MARSGMNDGAKESEGLTPEKLYAGNCASMEVNEGILRGHAILLSIVFGSQSGRSGNTELKSSILLPPYCPMGFRKRWNSRRSVSARIMHEF